MEEQSPAYSRGRRSRRQVFRNWSNDQFLVCLCELPAQRDSPIPQHGKHVSKSRSNPMRRFVEHERPVFGGQPA